MKIRIYGQQNNSLIIEEENSKFRQIESIFINGLAAVKVHEDAGVEQIYIDFSIDGSTVTLSLDPMEGITIECEDHILASKIMKLLERINLN